MYYNHKTYYRNIPIKWHKFKSLNSPYGSSFLLYIINVLVNISNIIFENLLTLRNAILYHIGTYILKFSKLYKKSTSTNCRGLSDIMFYFLINLRSDMKCSENFLSFEENVAIKII